jgi:hypothetical protein
VTKSADNIISEILSEHLTSPFANSQVLSGLAFQMPAPPGATPIPLPIFMPQSSSASALPQHSATRKVAGENTSKTNSKQELDPVFPLPKLLLEVRDLTHPGSRAFLSSVVPTTAIEFAVNRVLDLLYISPKCPTTTVPGTRSVTLILRSMGGVAYTTGTELDGDHKEIHFSIEYIDGIQKSRKADEILGVLTHEMVHCYQYNAQGTCPGGLIEGIADWVRLNSNLSPPHWKRETSGKWDAGYQHTGYFLDYLEKRYGDGTISRMNNKLRTGRYNEKAFWTELLGRPVEQLWSDYGEAVKAEGSMQPEPEPGTETESIGEEDEEMVMIEKEDAHSADKTITGKGPTTSTPTPTRNTEDQTGGPKSSTTNAKTVPAGVV